MFVRAFTGYADKIVGHFCLFKEIIKLGNTSENLQKMRRVDSPEQAYRLMMEILTDYQSPDERGSP